MNRIHETAVIGEDVVLGSGNVIGPFSVILGPCSIGNDNWIGPHVSLGGSAEIRGGSHSESWMGEVSQSTLTIGDRNFFREFSVIHSGPARGTSIGNDCYIMNNSYIAHDSDIGNAVTISASTLIGGHCTIHSSANLGMGAIVHQKSVIATLAMVGMGAIVTHHVEPFSLVYGSPARAHGVNRVGLQRAGYSDELIEKIEKAILTKASEQIGEFAPVEFELFKNSCADSQRRS